MKEVVILRSVVMIACTMRTEDSFLRVRMVGTQKRTLTRISIIMTIKLMISASIPLMSTRMKTLKIMLTPSVPKKVKKPKGEKGEKKKKKKKKNLDDVGEN